jgi:hypothetical protein
MTDTARALNSGEIEVLHPHSADTRSSVNGVKPMLMIATAALGGEDGSLSHLCGSAHACFRLATMLRIGRCSVRKRLGDG